MGEQPLTVFTIGHSTHTLEDFVTLLRQHRVTAVADVRSAPFSRVNPQFNKETIGDSLEEHGIKYVFLGRELGARPDDPGYYEKGRVQYSRLASSDLFKKGLERVVRGSRKYRIALMCAEKEPLDCHRTLLVSCALADRGVSVAHILADGRLESHSDAMERLLDLTGLPREDLFRSKQQLIAGALARQEERVAYIDPALVSGRPEDAS
jgi:uncharacterized protein (DUF488 family)